jgi:hypothetical protein
MSLEPRLRAWIDTQGYPIELRTAEALRSSSAGWSHGRTYLDPNTGKAREIDLIGYFDRANCAIHVVFECKHSRDKPWVVFATDRKTLTAVGYAHGVPATPSLREHLKDATMRALLDLRVFRDPERVGFNLVRAHTDNQDAAHQALGTLTAACQALCDSIGKYGHRVLYVPVVVIDSPLFTCYTSGTTGDYALRQVDTAVVQCPVPGATPMPVQVLHVGALAAFLSAVDDDATQLDDTFA